MENPKEDLKSETEPVKNLQKIDLMTQYGDHLEDAIADAQYMMIYAATNCPNEIKKDTIEKLIEARKEFENKGKLTAEQEADFWFNYQKLWRLVQPSTEKAFIVTAESIKANMPLKKTFFGWLLGFIPAFSRWTQDWTISKSHKMVNRYIFFTGLVLIILLFFQIYWVIGNQLFVQINELLSIEKDLKVQLGENAQVDVQKDLDSIESQLVRVSTMILDWSRPWYWLITRKDSEHTLQYEQKYTDINAKINDINSQLSDNSNITIAAENDPDVLNLLGSFQKNDDTLEDKINLSTFKNTLEEILASLSAQSEKVQGKVDEQQQQKIILVESLNQAQTERQAAIQNLTEQKSILSAQLADQKAQLAAWMSTPSPEASPATSSDTPSTLDQENQSDIQLLKEEIKSITNQIADIDNKLQTQLDSTRAAYIQGQIDTIDSQVVVSQELGADIEKKKKDLRDQLNRNTAAAEVQKTIDEMIDPNNTLAMQLAGLNAAREVIQGQINSLQSQIENKEIISKGLTTEQKDQIEMKKEEVVARITGELQQKRQQLMDEMDMLQRQEKAEQVDSIKENSGPVQIAGKSVLGILQDYLLPLLYGILGASIYVLRSLSRHISNVTYSDVSGIRHMVHIALGALAGILVGWFSFLIPSDTVIGSVSPLAIAFLVGYNIELVFTKMDEFVVTKVREIRQRTSLSPEEENQVAVMPKTLPMESIQKTSSGETSAPEVPATQ